MKYLKGKIKLQLQNCKQASYVCKLKKQDGHINWHHSAWELELFIRAMHPWPGAFTYAKKLNTKTKDQLTLKILAVQSKPIKINKHQAGKLFLHQNKLAVQCGQNALLIKTIQPAGKKSMNAKNFLNGYQYLINSVLK